MRHTGLQTFTTTDTTGEAKIFDCNILNKLSLPLHRPLSDPVFGDLFIETNALKVTNSDNEVSALLDINNPDMLKAILLSEIVYDEFFNYEKGLEESNSFHNLIDLTSTDITQITLDSVLDCTTDQTDTAILIDFTNGSLAEEIFLTLLNISQKKIPINTTLHHDSTSTVKMVYYDNVSYDNMLKRLTIQLTSDDNLTVRQDLTNADITQIELKTFHFIDSVTQDNYIELPKHYHELEDVSDMTTFTNVENGFVRFIDSNNIKMDFPWNLQVDKFRVTDSLFIKDQTDNIKKKKIFDVTMTNQLFDDELLYTDNTVDLGGGDFVIEYAFTQLNINTTELVELSTNDNQEINITKQFTITDTTEHEHSFLVEYLKFNSNLLLDPLNQGVTSVLDVFYIQVDKTAIDTTSLEIYNITDGTVTTLNCYYDISVTQPTINTVPFTVIERRNLYKDDYGSILISIPQVYPDIIGEKHFTIKNDSDFYVTFDSTIFPIELTIYALDLITNVQELLFTLDINDSNIKKVMPRGRIKVLSSTILNKYTIKLFNRTQ